MAEKKTTKPAETKATEEKPVTKAKSKEIAVKMTATQCGSYGVLSRGECYKLEASLASALISGGFAEEIPF